MRQIGLSVFVTEDMHSRLQAHATEQQCSISAVLRRGAVSVLDGTVPGTTPKLPDVEATISQIERALDRVLVSTIRLSDRVDGIGTPA